MDRNAEIEARKKQLRGYFDEDYLPGARGASSIPAAEHRVANSLEYIAHHMGRISRSLERIEQKLDAKG